MPTFSSKFLKIGSTNVKNVYIGDDHIREVYIGDNIVWPSPLLLTSHRRVYTLYFGSFGSWTADARGYAVGLVNSIGNPPTQTYNIGSLYPSDLSINGIYGSVYSLYWVNLTPNSGSGVFPKVRLYFEWFGEVDDFSAITLYIKTGSSLTAFTPQDSNFEYYSYSTSNNKSSWQWSADEYSGLPSPFSTNYGATYTVFVTYDDS